MEDGDEIIEIVSGGINYWKYLKTIQMEDIKVTIVNIWKSRAFQMFIDFCRIALVILAIAILIVLVKEIEAVKILNYDVCKLCAEKTGAVCASLQWP
jgi:hypothetical protein